MLFLANQVLHSIIQAWLLILASLSLCGISVSIRKALYFALVYGPLVILVRYIYSVLRVPFGTHTFILMVVIVILFKLFVNDISWVRSIIAMLIGLVLLLVGDAFFVVQAIRFFGLTVQQASSSMLWCTVLGLASDLSLILGLIAGKILGYTIYTSGVEQGK